MQSDKACFISFADGSLLPVFAYNYGITVQENTAFKLVICTEEYNFALEFLTETAQNRIVVIENTKIILVLIFCYGFLYCNLVFQCFMSVEMVRSDVEYG